MANTAEVPAVIRAAADELARLCAGRGGMTRSGLAGRDWTMCVPRRDDYSDSIFVDLIEAAAKWERALAPPRDAQSEALWNESKAEDRMAIVELYQRLFPADLSGYDFVVPRGARGLSLEDYRAAIIGAFPVVLRALSASQRAREESRAEAREQARANRSRGARDGWEIRRRRQAEADEASAARAAQPEGRG